MQGFLNVFDDPTIGRDIAVNLISEIIGAILLVAMIGSAIAFVSETRRNAKRREFVLRFLRVCDVFRLRFDELLRVWDQRGGSSRYERTYAEETPIERVFWRMGYVTESIETATKIADFAAPILNLDDLRDQFEILTGLWRIDGELKRTQSAANFERKNVGSFSIDERRYVLEAIRNQKEREYVEFWLAIARLKKKWRYEKYVINLKDQYTDEVREQEHGIYGSRA